MTSAEWTNRKKDGGFYLEKVSISPIFDDRGRITNYLAVKEDVTPSRAAEARLVESEKRYRTIVETAHEGVLLLSREGRIDFVNRRLLEMLDSTSEALLDTPKQLTVKVESPQLPPLLKGDDFRLTQVPLNPARRGTLFAFDLAFAPCTSFGELPSFLKPMAEARTLIVREETEGGSYLAEAVAGLGFRAEEVTSRQAAIDASLEADLSMDPHRVVLVEYSAAAEGIEAVAELCSLPTEDRPRFLLITACDQLKMDLQGAEVAQVLPRPVSRTTLENALAETLLPDSVHYGVPGPVDYSGDPRPRRRSRAFLSRRKSSQLPRITEKIRRGPPQQDHGHSRE